MGWNFIRQAARFNKVLAVTRKNNREDIVRYMQEHPDGCYANIHFMYFDLPYWARFWKKGSRGALLYFYLWQLFLPRYIRNSGCEFDIAHNLNFHNDWTPSRLWTLGKPFVWGPVGHHPVIPHEFVIGPYGTFCYFRDRLRWFAKKLIWNFDPLLHATVRNADAVITMNNSVEKVLDLRHKKLFVIPSVGTERTRRYDAPVHEQFHVLAVGRFVPLKGFDVAIKSFAKFYHGLEDEDKKKTRLTLIGKGSLKSLLEKTAVSENVKEAVEFTDWTSRKALESYYRRSSVFLFPSHEGAGMVVAEALSYGLPVICFDNCGPGELITPGCGISIPYENYNCAISSFSKSLKKLFTDKVLLSELSAGAINRFESRFEWNVKGEQLQQVYHSVYSQASEKKPKNKILCIHLLNDYSGSPLVFAEAIKGLKAAGHEVELFTCGHSTGFLTGITEKHHTFWYRFYQNRYARLAAFTLSQLLLFFRILKYAGQQVDIYVNTLLPCGAALAGKMTGKKVIYHLHETSINPPLFKRTLKMVAEATANTAIYVSHFLMKTEPLRGVQRSVIHNALPDEFVDKASGYRLHKANRDRPFYVLMLCSLKTYKGVSEFVDLAERMTHIKFDLVLNTAQEQINKYFTGRQLPPNLTIYPATDNVHPFYERASLVLNLSHPDQWIETFGMTILEAMCYGIPVIAPPVGGVTELVQPNINGYLKDVRNQHDLQNTIHQIYADPQLCKRLGEQAVLTAEKFRMRSMQEKVCEIIERPVGKN